MRKFHVVQATISLAAIAAAILHGLKLVQIDSITIGLLIVAALPWLAQVLASAELPGGWKVEFRALKERQDLQAREVATLRFLARSFLTDSELGHLERLAADEPFPFSRGPTTESFKHELRRLRGLGLIKSPPESSLSKVLREDRADLRAHVTVTSSGHEYLALRQQIEADADQVP
jgi:hypothetical protein